MTIMLIKQIELLHIAVPLKRIFETSFGKINNRPALIIKVIADDGRVGYGESSPLYKPMSETETISSGINVLKKILPNIIGCPIEKDFDITSFYKEEHYPVSTIGIEGAYLDLVSQLEGVPLYKTFGGNHTVVMAGESIGLQDSVQNILKEVARYVDIGFRRIKMKIAPGRDVEVIKVVRSAFPDISLGVDANAAYSASDIVLLEQLAKYNLAFVEQPFPANEYVANIRLRHEGIKICLDETITDISTCVRAVEEGACDMVNIKPARIGSFKESKAIHDYCFKEGIKLFGGGKTINAAFYALPGFTDASDITSPTDYFETDIIEPAFSLQKDLYKSLEGVGLGVKIKEDIVNKFLCEKIIF